MWVQVGKQGQVEEPRPPFRPSPPPPPPPPYNAKMWPSSTAVHDTIIRATIASIASARVLLKGGYGTQKPKSACTKNSPNQYFLV